MVVTSRGGDAFTFRSGRPSLDFAATQMFRSGDPLELLSEPGALRAWAVAAGLVDAVPADDALDAAIALREAIYRAAVGVLEGAAPAPADAAILNAAAASAPVVVSLGPEGIARAGTCAQVLSTLARDAIDVLGGADATRLRQCGRDGCTRLFLDRSRGGSRVWCGMRECGNRVNAAAYRRRRDATR